MTVFATCVPPRLRRALGFAPALGLAAVLSGCLSYSPDRVHAMSAYDLCEAQLYSRVNYTADTQARIRRELEQRKEDCSKEVPAIEADREFQLYDAMYGRSGP